MTPPDPSSPPHLAPGAAALLDLSDDMRIRAIRTERWVGFARARRVLEILQALRDHPPSIRLTYWAGSWTSHPHGFLQRLFVSLNLRNGKSVIALVVRAAASGHRDDSAALAARSTSLQTARGSGSRTNR
jgi:hypothetical protein